jgi:hypothetical protein
MLGAGLRVALEVTARFRVIAQATASLYLPQVRVLFAQTVVAILSVLRRKGPRFEEILKTIPPSGLKFLKRIPPSPA